MSGFEEEQIDRVYTKADSCYAVGQSGRCYVWGNLENGMGLQPATCTSEVPIRCKTLESMNYSDITMSGSSAVGIGSSVLLKFTFPDMKDQDDDNTEQ